MADRQQGTVKWFDNAKGYGFNLLPHKAIKAGRLRKFHRSRSRAFATVSLCHKRLLQSV